MLDLRGVSSIALSFLSKYSGSMKIITHLDHISHCKIILVIDWYNLVEYK